MGCCHNSTGEKTLDLPADSIQQQTSVKTDRPSNSVSQVKIRPAAFVHMKKCRLETAYELTEKLGDGMFHSGAYGVVFKAKHLATGEIRAVKTIQKKRLPKAQAQQMLSEVEILKQLVNDRQDHPNIIKVMEVIETKKAYNIITELCTGGELFDRIVKSRYLTENLAAFYMHQVLSAVAYCHNRGIVHRDLKPENLLLENDSPEAMLKVIDFGTSCKVIPGLHFSSVTGTPYYIAPEILQGKYTEKCDVWSCGVILFILLCGSPPFPGKNDSEILAKVRLGTYSFESKD